MRVNGMGISLITLVIIMILTISINTNTQSADTPDYDFYLRELAEKASIKIGFAAVNNFWSMADSEQYMEIAKNEFNILTPENQMKMDSLQPDMDSFNFEQADRHVRFAEENGMDVHGHALVWHNQTPSWLTETNWEKEELDKILKEHIKTVVEHYKGKVKVWDVVNEAFMDDGSYRRSIWYNVLGKEYIEKSFVRANEIDPDATLIYNDYGIGSINNKSNAIYEMAKDFKERGIPLDGIGFQMHISERYGFDEKAFADNLERFADLGLDLYITELDVRLTEKSMDSLLYQADIYTGLMDVCLAQPAVKAVQTWGFTDKHSWIPNHFSGMGWALLFDEEYHPKASYYALKEALTAFISTMEP